MKKQDYYCLSGLKKRGWTDKLINKYFPIPDKLGINKYYKSGPKVKLYEINKVHKKENLKGFKDYIEKNKEKRKKLSEKILERNDDKRKKLKDYISGLKIKIPIMSEERLYKKAINSYNDLWCNRDKPEKCISLEYDKLDKDFLDRITMNYLRHTFNNYESEIDKLFGKVGKDEGYSLLKEIIEEKILETYPFLY